MDSTTERATHWQTNVGVMVVDDQAVFRRAARAVIDATVGFAHAGDAASGPEALRAVDELHPDLVLMDVGMPGMDGCEAARRLTDSHPECVVVLVSIDSLEDEPATTASCGAVAFLRKQDLRPAMLRDLWTIHGGVP